MIYLFVLVNNHVTVTVCLGNIFSKYLILSSRLHGSLREDLRYIVKLFLVFVPLHGPHSVIAHYDIGEECVQHGKHIITLIVIICAWDPACDAHPVHGIPVPCLLPMHVLDGPLHFEVKWRYGRSVATDRPSARL